MKTDNTSKKKKLITTAVLCCGLLAAGVALTVGGIRAYLTSIDRAVNTFTIGEVTIDTLEPNYPGNGSDEVKDMVPGKEVKKDPQIKNTGKNRIIAFIRFDIPMKDVITAQEDGTRNPKANTELFEYRTLDRDYNSVHDEKWVLLDTSYLDNDGKTVTQETADKVSRLYGYKTVVEENETTLPIFDVVKLTNIIEGMADNSVQNIVITSYAIQADNIADVTSPDWNDEMDQAKLSEIFEVYMKQSGDIEPSDADNSNNQTLKNSTLNITFTVANTHLQINSGDNSTEKTTTKYNVAYVGPNEKPDHEFTSSNTDVVTVDHEGNIKAVGAGRAVITMTAVNPDNGKTATASVTVTVRDMNSGALSAEEGNGAYDTTGGGSGNGAGDIEQPTEKPQKRVYACSACGKLFEFGDAGNAALTKHLQEHRDNGEQTTFVDKYVDEDVETIPITE